MAIFICYTILALLFFLLATGKFKPKTWQELPPQKVKLIRFGCFFFSAVITLNLLTRLFTR